MSSATWIVLVVLPCFPAPLRSEPTHPTSTGPLPPPPPTLARLVSPHQHPEEIAGGSAGNTPLITAAMSSFDWNGHGVSEWLPYHPGDVKHPTTSLLQFSLLLMYGANVNARNEVRSYLAQRTPHRGVPWPAAAAPQNASPHA